VARRHRRCLLHLLGNAAAGGSTARRRATWTSGSGRGGWSHLHVAEGITAPPPAPPSLSASASPARPKHCQRCGVTYRYSRVSVVTLTTTDKSSPTVGGVYTLGRVVDMNTSTAHWSRSTSPARRSDASWTCSRPKGNWQKNAPSHFHGSSPARLAARRRGGGHQIADDVEVSCRHCHEDPSISEQPEWTSLVTKSCVDVMPFSS
jgi:hypothetical protein